MLQGRSEELSKHHAWQWATGAMVISILFGLAMIANTQMQGDSSWFWYATVLHKGVHIYRDLHMPLQPFFVLETDAWMRLFGTSAIGFGVRSLLHALVLSVGMVAILRQTRWPASIQAIAVVMSFVVSLQAPGFRFDDYHIVAQTSIWYSLLLLLWLRHCKTDVERRLVACGLGVLAGVAITTRLNDGGMLLIASVVCVLAMYAPRPVVGALIVIAAAALTVVVVVMLTGDSLRAYLDNSVLRVSAAKGGSNAVAKAPVLLFFNTLKYLKTSGKREFAALAGLAVMAWPVLRWRRRGLWLAVALQVVVAFLLMASVHQEARAELLGGSLVTHFCFGAILAAYVLAIVAGMRWVMAMVGWLPKWNRLEILVVIPALEMVSASASTAGEPFQGFYVQTAMCLVLLMVIYRSQLWPKVAEATLVSVMILLAISGVVSKWREPYTWQKYNMATMFTDRVWYHDPYVGPLYLEKPLLAMNSSFCDQIRSGTKLELLSLPYSYPNYFCGIPPWHNYVQTYFDTSTKATIDGLTAELRQSPPEWIVYQRQLAILRGQEKTYNHGQPLPHRALDELIMSRIHSGAWKVEGTSDYLGNDGGWYLIRTHA